MTDVHSPATRSYNMSRIILLVMALVIYCFQTSNAQEPEIVNYYLSECDRRTSLNIIQEGILTMEYRFDTLHIELSRILNCSQGHRPTVSFSNDTLTLNTFLRGSFETDETGDSIEWFEEYAYCNCCFTVNFYVVDIPDTPAVVLHNEKIMQKIPNRLVPFYTINDMHDTLWRHDHEGFIYTNKTFPSGKTVWIEKSNWDQRIIRAYNSMEQLVLETIINHKASRTVIERSYYYAETGVLLRVEERIIEL